MNEILPHYDFTGIELNGYKSKPATPLADLPLAELYYAYDFGEPPINHPEKPAMPVVVTPIITARPPGQIMVPPFAVVRSCKSTPDIVKELIERRRAKGKGERWLTTLKQQLDKFSESFPGELKEIESRQIDAWLLTLTVSERTRLNYFEAVRQLIRYAQSQAYVPKTLNLLEDVEVPDPELSDILIFTPEEARKLLCACPVKLLGFLALTLFSGVRHEEMSARTKKVLLKWEDVNLRDGIIRVDKRAAKIKRRRWVTIRPNLKAWLETIPSEFREGRICSLEGTANALGRLGTNAGVPWKKNAHRKSFISYRIAETGDVARTAFEAGTSKGEIEGHYLELVTAAEAQDYFAILPPPGLKHAKQEGFSV